MIFKSNLIKERYKPGEIGKMLGVSARTILNYNDNDLFNMWQDKETGRWYASKDEVCKLLDKKGLLYDDTKDNTKFSIVYARVSSNDQKANGALERQIGYLVSSLQEKGINLYEVYSDVGSGLNANRSGLNKLIESVKTSNIEAVYITYKDRLTRFGFEYLENFFGYFGTKIVVLKDDKDKTEQEELVEDMMSLIASFSGKLYGMRSSKKRKMKQYIDEIQEND